MVCRDLGIDDPVAWMNAAPPEVVDQWIAFYTLKDQDSSGAEMMSPDQALKRLQSNG